MSRLVFSAAEPTSPAAAFNQQIRRLVAMLAGRGDDGREYGFMCECGCDATVPLTIAKLDDDGGAWSERHKPVNSPRRAQ